MTDRERAAHAIRATREFQAAAAFGLPKDAREVYCQALADAVIAALTPERNVSNINALLGVNLWAVRSFRADVRIDFDEDGRVLAAAVLNPDPAQVPEPPRNPYLPLPPEDGQHVYWDSPTDIGGNYRCKLCGAYRGSAESQKPCLGEFRESGKMHSWAKRKWDEERAAESSGEGV